MGKFVEDADSGCSIKNYTRMINLFSYTFELKKNPFIVSFHQKNNNGLLEFYFIYFWPCHMPCGILVPQPGIEPAVKVPSPNGWNFQQRGILDISMCASLC